MTYLGLSLWAVFCDFVPDKSESEIQLFVAFVNVLNCMYSLSNDINLIVCSLCEHTCAQDNPETTEPPHITTPI